MNAAVEASSGISHIISKGNAVKTRQGCHSVVR